MQSSRLLNNVVLFYLVKVAKTIAPPRPFSCEGKDYYVVTATITVHTNYPIAQYNTAGG